MLISTCGFYSANKNYDSVLRMFDHFLGKGNCTTVFCGQGELFRVKELSARTNEYLTAVKCAGSEYARTGALSKETDEILHTLLYPKDVFKKMADASWESTKRPERKNLMFLCLSDKWLLFITKTPFAVWSAISCGEIGGAEALTSYSPTRAFNSSRSSQPSPSFTASSASCNFIRSFFSARSRS